MTFLKWLIWTVCAVALGVYLASGNIDGRTPLEHAQRAWKQTGLDHTLEDAKDAVTDAKDKVAGKPAKPPRERITKDEREAVNRLIAQQK